MILNPDTVFYHIFYSIRGDWSYGVDKRADWLIEILPHTTIKEDIKPKFKEHLIKMKKTYLDDKNHVCNEDCEIFSYNGGRSKMCQTKTHFDGRSWARSYPFNYYTLYNQFETPNDTLDVEWGESTDGTKRCDPLEEFGGTHEASKNLYNVYQTDIWGALTELGYNTGKIQAYIKLRK